MEKLDFQQILDLPENAPSKKCYENNNKNGFEVRTLILLQNETQRKLWEEMQGQISDGKWEECKNTEWLWNNELALVVPGLETPQVICKYAYLIGKKNYFMSPDLRQNIGEDLTKRCGYENVTTMIKDWNLIASAIRNVQIQSNLAKVSVESFIYGWLDMGLLQATQRNEILKKANEKKWEEEKLKIIPKLHELGYDTCNESMMGSDRVSHFRVDFGNSDLTDKAESRTLEIRLTLTGCCNDQIEVSTDEYNYFHFNGKFTKVSIKEVLGKILALIRCVDGDYPEEC